MRFVIGLTLILSVSGCSSLFSKEQKEPENNRVYGAQVGIVNHTEKFIYTTRVNDGGGGHAYPYSAGIANICCVTVPDKWRPDLKFSVRWDIPIGSKHVCKEKVVEVERYDEPGSVYLHFFPDDQVRIVVTTWVGGAPECPIPPPVKPAGFSED
jgi:hypothetical protein